MPPEKLALMSKREVDETWDYHERHLAHQIACVLAIASISDGLRRKKKRR